MSCITIPVVSCKGRKGEIVLGSKTYLQLEGSDYWDIHDAYLHIDCDREKELFGNQWQPTEEEYIAAVKRLCIENFAGKTVSHELFRISRKAQNVGLKSPVKIFHELLAALFPPADPFADLFKGNKRIKHKISIKNLRYYFLSFTIYKKETVEVVERHGHIPFGGSWQKYFDDSSWIAQAEEIKGKKIYLASRA